MINRYKNKEIDYIFSDENKFNNWLKIELLVLEYYQKSGLISKDELASIKESISIDVEEIYQIEKITKHDVIAFVEHISSQVNDSSKKWIHYGLTSTDVVDTGNAVAIKQLNKLILDRLNKLMITVKKLALRYKKTVEIGRTHGVHAEITTFGLKAAIWYDELNRHKERLISAFKEIEVGKISGAVGTHANTGIKLQDYVCKKLKIGSAKISTQIISRDIHANYFSTLNLLGLSINKIASELRHLARTEIFEVSEFFDKNQKGSSAMPHKKNPITLENICGLSRLLSGYSLTINENVPLWNERDISHSSNERVVFLDATTIVVNILEKLTKTLSNLIVNKKRMLENVKMTKDVIFSQTLLLNLIKSNDLSRKENYEKVQTLAFKAFNENRSFKEVVLEDEEINNYLSEKEINNIFDYNYHLKYVDKIFDKVFKK